MKFIENDQSKSARKSSYPRRDIKAFHEALNVHRRRCGDTLESLQAAALQAGLSIHQQSITGWVRAEVAPRSRKAFEFFAWLERRYGLPEDYFRTKLYGKPDSYLNIALRIRTGNSRSELRWHLPDDFDERSAEERQKIVRWIENNILSCSTEYGKYLRKVCSEPFALRFPKIIAKGERRHKEPRPNPTYSPLLVDAPPRLSTQVADIVMFKTAAFTALGFERNSRWNKTTTKSKVHQLGLLFGTLSAPSNSPIAGFGIPPENLSVGLLVFPSLWDKYLEWCRNRRGFFTRFEQSLLHDFRSFTRSGTGWMSQHPELADDLTPVPGIISDTDILEAQRNWAHSCAAMHQYTKSRYKDLGQVLRQHRDTFAPIMVILNSDSPLGEYRKIADEVMRRMPDEKKQPRAAAEAIRAYLLLRFGMHLGLRQRNLRELLVCFRGDNPRGERKLEELGRGEIRWCKTNGGWQVFIPSTAFKNARSSFFAGNPFSLMLPDLEGLYAVIEAYLDRHRPLLLAQAKDPATFFIKTVRTFTKTAAFDINHFYRTWRETIQRYGIHNPYTGRGVIEGLLPHGPHGVRDVLATHVLKQTGSYDLASYAIQDTPRMVAGHYGRFLPEDKAAQAARVLNRIWMPEGGAGKQLERFEFARLPVPARTRPYLDKA